MQLVVMDVSDVKSVKSLEPAKSSRPAAQKPASELSAEKINVSRAEPVRVEVSERSERSGKSREKANEVISALNVVANVTEELDKIVTSLSGLAEQAADTGLPDSRRNILEQEAQGLLQAIDDHSQVETEQGIKPLKGDPIELQVEEELGKTLKVILPETSKEELGLGQLSVSRVDTILATRRSIVEAKNRLEDLRSTVLNSQSEVKQILNQVDIASQNKEAAAPSVRDVDSALKLTGGIQGFISQDPEAALGAVGAVSARLLSGD